MKFRHIETGVEVDAIFFDETIETGLEVVKHFKHEGLLVAINQEEEVMILPNNYYGDADPPIMVSGWCYRELVGGGFSQFICKSDEEFRRLYTEIK